MEQRGRACRERASKKDTHEPRPKSHQTGLGRVVANAVRNHFPLIFRLQNMPKDTHEPPPKSHQTCLELMGFPLQARPLCSINHTAHSFLMRFGDWVSLVLSLDTYEPVLNPDGLSVSACRTVCGHTQCFQVPTQKQSALAERARALTRLSACAGGGKKCGITGIHCLYFVSRNSWEQLEITKQSLDREEGLNRPAPTNGTTHATLLYFYDNHNNYFYNNHNNYSNDLHHPNPPRAQREREREREREGERERERKIRQESSRQVLIVWEVTLYTPHPAPRLPGTPTPPTPSHPTHHPPLPSSPIQSPTLENSFK